jgi:hypothetical protein
MVWDSSQQLLNWLIVRGIYKMGGVYVHQKKRILTGLSQVGFR